MSEKTFKTRVIQKHDTCENWLKAVNFVPLEGELIVYTDGNPYKLKIGDGITPVNNLPFAEAALATIDSPVFTGSPKAPTVNYEEYDPETQGDCIATCAFVMAAISSATSMDIEGSTITAADIDVLTGTMLDIYSPTRIDDKVLELL